MCKVAKAVIVLMSVGVFLAGCPNSSKAPTASFSVSTNGLTVTFSDTSRAGSASITQWAWNFGDSSTSTQQNPSHTYAAAGNYTVSLTVTTSVGSDTDTQSVTVEQTLSGVWYVKPNGSGNGTSWSDACGSIQDAIDAAANAGGGEVWVAAGTYGGEAGEATQIYTPAEELSLTQSYTVGMKNRVDIYGGFAGTEAGRDDRDWEANETIIDGETERLCVYCYGVSDSTLDGFVLQNGKGKYAAGMFNSSSSPTVSNCTFTGNVTTSGDTGGGAGMHNHLYSSPTVSGCTFTENTGTYGGGMFNAYYSSPTVIDSTFTANTAPAGGGMCNLSSSSPTVSNCSFHTNAATSEAGGGMCNLASSSPTVINCIFKANTAPGGGGVFNSYYSSPTFTNCTFSENTAIESGGGIGNYDSSAVPTVTNCIFWNDTVTLGGGEIAYVLTSGAAPVVTYSCIQGGCDGTDNTSADPLFVDTANGDYSLQSGSPCINTGTSEGAPDTDILGVVRPQGGGYDMGAYEYVGE